MKKILIAIFVVVAVATLLAGGFSLGYKAGRMVPKTVLVQGLSNVEEGKPAEADFGTFWQAWGVIDEIYLNHDDVSASDRLYGAISGLVKSLRDPHSEFFLPDDNQKFQEDIQGSFGGIGAELGTKDNQIVIVAPLKNTPAERAGLKPEDKILAVNSSSTYDVSVDQVVKWIRGPIGEEVTLAILRGEWDKPQDFKIIRANIVIPTLETENIDGDIVHVKLYSFNGNAPQLFYDTAFDILSKGKKGVVLDLRNNPGGYLEVSVELAGWFLPKGSLVVTQEGIGEKKQDFRAVGNSAFENLPLTILINKGSASASEILAGAIKVYRDDVKLVGEKTFGKGTVQELRDLRDGSSLKLTISHWVLPNGKIIEKEGIEPDIAVEMTEEDYKEGKDPQLEKAIEILKSEISKSANR